MDKQPLVQRITEVTSTLDEILETIQNKKERDKISRLIDRSVQLAHSAVKKNVSLMLRNLCDLLSYACLFIPVAGNILSSVCCVISQCMCGIGGSVGIGSIVKKEIELVLDKFEDSQLKSEVSGTVRVFSYSLAYLEARTSGHHLKKHELAALKCNVPVFNGVKILGILSQRIQEIAKINDMEHGRRAIEYTKLYVTLAILRSSILTIMVHVVESAGHSSWTVAGIRKVLIYEENNDKEFLKFLTTPKYEMACLFSLLKPSEEKLLSSALEKYGLNFQKLDFQYNQRSTFTAGYLEPMKMCGDVCGWINAAGIEERFIITPVNDDNDNVDNVFYIRPARWRNWYVYMTNDAEGFCRAWNGLPGPQGQWKFIRLMNDRYMFSPIKWPDWFVYMRAIRVVRGWKNDPGEQGYWKIEKC